MQQIVISLISGALGGNAPGAILKKFDLGGVWNSIVGFLGGVAGGQLLSAMQDESSASPSIISNIFCSALGGFVLMSIVGLIRVKLTNKNA